MRIIINYEIELTDNEITAAGIHAETLGHGYDDPGKQLLVKRLLQDAGIQGMHEALGPGAFRDECVSIIK